MKTATFLLFAIASAPMAWAPPKCAVQSRCCSASANCDANQVCICWADCPRDGGLCVCECEDMGPQEPPTCRGNENPLDVNEPGWSVTVSDGATLGAVVGTLAKIERGGERLCWPPDLFTADELALPVEAGVYSGTLAEIVAELRGE